MQVFHRILRNQGCSFTRNWIGAAASHFFPHPTLSLASEQTLKDLKRSQGHQTWRWGEWIWPSGLHRNSPYYWHFMNFITLPIYRLLTLLSATKWGFKELWTWCFSPYFPCTSGTAPVTQPGTTVIHNRAPKYGTFSCSLLMTFLIVLPTPSLHIEMVMYRGIKICYKNDIFFRREQE